MLEDKNYSTRRSNHSVRRVGEAVAMQVDIIFSTMLHASVAQTCAGSMARPNAHKDALRASMSRSGTHAAMDFDRTALNASAQHRA